MKRIKLVAVLFSLTFFNCTSYVKVVEAHKKKNISGLKSGKNYLDYTLKVDAKEAFSFLSIHLDGKPISESLYIKDLATGLSTTNIKSEYKKGSYLFCFRIYNTKQMDLNEKLKFSYKTKDKEHNIDTFVKKSKTVVMRR